MNRSFKTQVIGTEFVITELATNHWTATDRQGAWDRARAQANPVVFVALDGTRRELGDCFDTATWERKMYTGYVSYNTSMTDGYYAPEAFDRWAIWFRQDPTAVRVDVTPETADAMTRYLATR